MAVNKRSVILLLVLIFSVEFNNGSRIDFKCSGPVTPLLTHSLNLKCTFNSSFPQISGAVVGRRKRDVTETTENVHPVAILILREDGQRVASVSEYSGAKAHVNDSNIHVTGNLEGHPGNQGFLEVRWSYPSTSQVSGYRCEVNTLDDFGKGIMFAKNITVTDVEPSMNDLVNHIHEMQLSQDQHKLQIDSLKTKYQTSQGEIINLKDEITELKHVESGLIECGDSRKSPWVAGRSYTGDHGRTVDKTQTFKTDYKRAPIVYLSIMNREHETNSASTVQHQYGLMLLNVDTHKFNMRCFVDSDAGYSMHMRVSWISFSH